jgi:hypothetical protein
LEERVDSRMRYDDFRKRLEEAVLNAPGDTPEALRRAVLENGSIPPALASYVDTVKRHAFKVTDADIAALQRAGHSDDALFEITVAAAVGAALHRLDRGMAALHGQEPD